MTLKPPTNDSTAMKEGMGPVSPSASSTRAANAEWAEAVERHPLCETLQEVLQELARAELAMEAPPRVEAAVMRAWDAAHGAARSSGMSRERWTGAMAVAAAVVLACTVTLFRSRQLPPDTAPVPEAQALSASQTPAPVITSDTKQKNVPRAPRRRMAPGTSVSARDSTQPITMVLVGGPFTAGEQVHVVRVRIARETLMSMGLRAVATAGDETVDVDMLIGEDGVARGLRVGM